MPKKIKFESFKYRFLIAAEQGCFVPHGTARPAWTDFVRGLEFAYQRGTANIQWAGGPAGGLRFDLSEMEFHRRGDDERHRSEQNLAGLLTVEDPIKQKNEAYFQAAVSKVSEAAGYRVPDPRSDRARRFTQERDFHDAWAHGEDIDQIDVRAVNEACTAPEMRYITSRLGDLRGKLLLDVGCGLGEASVYFALRGAVVMSTDLSQGMLDATCNLALRNGVRVTPHLASAEDLNLPANMRFDIIYAGNLLHHVDIEETITRLKPHLAQDGLFVTWDPVAYNPIINVYRAIATDVRTPDEHPLKWRDIQIFRKHFTHVETRYFWLTTLVIFLLMALAQRRNPNKERFWKVIVQEEKQWRRIYSPLERIDRILLMVLPPLRLLCWNIVVVSRL